MQLTVYDQQGKRHDFQRNAATIMELIRDEGLAIAAQCGGTASCATCHVYVDPGWLDRLPPAEPHELDMLEVATDMRPESRLSCQIRVLPALDGLIVTLAPGTEF
ncbi:2Fe-2S iron-sulfur cluster-binding protein [Allorhizobium pseudoryzae]|uniref:2Fe-2S iron-sulfur cluster-binding protein n=1 Tax=Allorhizobium pseudoryzae TaxID=379684 RepID=UPI003D00F332